MFERYLDEIGREPLLSAEELSLARRMRSGDAKSGKGTRVYAHVPI